jgi:hypothetical protein
MTMFRTNADGTAVCLHRDLSVCPECSHHPHVVEVSGAHYAFPDKATADEARLVLADI